MSWLVAPRPYAVYDLANGIRTPPTMATRLTAEPTSMSPLNRSSRQKPRLLPAATKPMSEKRPEASFSNGQECHGQVTEAIELEAGILHIIPLRSFLSRQTWANSPPSWPATATSFRPISQHLPPNHAAP